MGKKPQRTFELGDRVTWRSQAAGSYKTKVGKIIEVVAVGRRPTAIGGYRYATPRSVRSYVIEVPRLPTKRLHVGKPLVYWPLVQLLKPFGRKAK